MYHIYITWLTRDRWFDESWATQDEFPTCSNVQTDQAHPRLGCGVSGWPCRAAEVVRLLRNDEWTKCACAAGEPRAEIKTKKHNVITTKRNDNILLKFTCTSDINSQCQKLRPAYCTNSLRFGFAFPCALFCKKIQTIKKTIINYRKYGEFKVQTALGLVTWSSSSSGFVLESCHCHVIIFNTRDLSGFSRH